jgi:hypothetical protein
MSTAWQQHIAAVNRQSGLWALKRQLQKVLCWYYDDDYVSKASEAGSAFLGSMDAKMELCYAGIALPSIAVLRPVLCLQTSQSSWAGDRIQNTWFVNHIGANLLCATQKSCCTT